MHNILPPISNSVYGKIKIEHDTEGIAEGREDATAAAAAEHCG